MINLKTIIDRTGELPPLSPTVARLAQVVSLDTSTIDEVVEVIRFDEAITVDVLKAANSAFSGSQRRIATVKDAVIRLGGGRILAQLVARQIRTGIATPLPVYGYEENELWRHSVAAACAAEQLAAAVKSSIGGLSFTAALLHDIGKLILGRCAVAEDIAQMHARLSETASGTTWEQAERTVLGFSHVDIGAEILSSWKLPDEIVSAVRNHHRLDAQGSLLDDAVKVANFMARCVGEGIGEEGMSLIIDDEIPHRIGLQREELEKACAATRDRVAGVLEMYGG